MEPKMQMHQIVNRHLNDDSRRDMRVYRSRFPYRAEARITRLMLERTDGLVDRYSGKETSFDMIDSWTSQVSCRRTLLIETTVNACPWMELWDCFVRPGFPGQRVWIDSKDPCKQWMNTYVLNCRLVGRNSTTKESSRSRPAVNRSIASTRMNEVGMRDAADPPVHP